MRIEIIDEIDSENKDSYSFNLFDLTAVFVCYHKESKAKGKKKWTITTFWDKYGRYSRMDEPELPIRIRNAVLLKVQDMIKVNTWKEWKQ